MCCTMTFWLVTDCIYEWSQDYNRAEKILLPNDIVAHTLLPCLWWCWSDQTYYAASGHSTYNYSSRLYQLGSCKKVHCDVCTRMNYLTRQAFFWMYPHLEVAYDCILKVKTTCTSVHMKFPRPLPSDTIPQRQPQTSSFSWILAVLLLHVYMSDMLPSVSTLS